MFEKQIESGVAFLNENFSDWLGKINLEELNMTDGKCCILGQVRPGEDICGFHSIKHEYNLSWNETEEMGFGVSYEDEEKDVLAWGILQQEWENKIKELRSV